jgi:hypothetical protein
MKQLKLAGQGKLQAVGLQVGMVHGNLQSETLCFLCLGSNWAL